MARRRNRRAIMLGILLVTSLVSWRSWGRPLRLFDLIKPRPDFGNMRYGPHERNILDLWKAKPSGGLDVATPVVIFFHGGGFRSGDKSSVPAGLLSRCLEAGISVASANYRLSHTAPYPAPMLDGARAIQFMRSKAKELGIDPARIAGSGSSAGAGIALWVAFHDDLADPQSTDPVARQSSRLTCVGVDGAQTSYDPRFIKALIGGRAHEHPALPLFYGISSESDVIHRGYTNFTRRPRPSTTSRPTTRRQFSFTPSRKDRFPPTPSRARESITPASARRSRPSSTHSKSSAFSIMAASTPKTSIPSTACVAT